MNSEVAKTPPKTYFQDEAFNASLNYFNQDDLAARVWLNKYALKDSQGNLYELTPNDMHRRIAKELARVEKNYANPLSEQEIFDLIKDFLSSSWSTDDYKYDLFHISAIVEPFNPYTSVDLNYNQALQTFTLTVNNDDPSRTFYNILINDVQITDLGNPTFNYNQEYTLNLPLTGDVINKITVKDVFSVGCYLDDVYVDEGAISDCQQSVTDEEGNVYCTVRIGNLNWMAENLRLSKAGSSYDGELNYESRLYGRLYTFDEIMNGYAYSESTSSNVIRGLCPQGWHLPRLAE